jgi:hypothetical protein
VLAVVDKHALKVVLGLVMELVKWDARLLVHWGVSMDVLWDVMEDVMAPV